jgi:hypothetical protein
MDEHNSELTRIYDIDEIEIQQFKASENSWIKKPKQIGSMINCQLRDNY